MRLVSGRPPPDDTGIGNPVEGRRIAASSSPVRATSALPPSTTMAVPAVRVNGAPAFVAIEPGAGTIRIAVEDTIGPARGAGPVVGAVALQAIEKTAATGGSANRVLIIDLMTQSAAQRARVQA